MDQKKSRNDEQDLGMYGNYYMFIGGLTILDLSKFSNYLYLVKWK
jgi:hypothetical protein